MVGIYELGIRASTELKQVILDSEFVKVSKKNME